MNNTEELQQSPWDLTAWGGGLGPEPEPGPGSSVLLWFRFLPTAFAWNVEEHGGCLQPKPPSQGADVDSTPRQPAAVDPTAESCSGA